MVSETFTLVRARGLTKVGEGGGLPGENITVHRVKLSEIPAFVEQQRAEGKMIDVRVLMLLASHILA